MKALWYIAVFGLVFGYLTMADLPVTTNKPCAICGGSGMY